MSPSPGPESLVVAIGMLLSGLLIGWLGYRIRYQQDYHLISGYRPGTASDEEGLAGLVGGVTIGLGLLTGLWGLGALVVETQLGYRGSYLAVLLVGLVVVQVRGRRYAT